MSTVAEQHAIDGDAAVGFTIVNRIADLESVDPMDLDPLFEVVDAEALETLFQSNATSNAFVSFEYHGYRVVVDAEKRVRISAADTFQ